MLEKLKIALVFCLLSSVLAIRAETSEIKVDLKLDHGNYVSGERIRGVVTVDNLSPDKVSVGYPDSADSFFVEVSRSSDGSAMTRVSKHPFVARFSLASGEGQKLEAFLGDHYGLRMPSRYLAKPVLVHRGVRYEGAVRAFDVVEGMRVASATQLFARRPNLRREFSLVFWNQEHSEHLFLKAVDSGSSDRKWETRDLGPILRIDNPVLSILPTGEVVILHRRNQDQFVRSEYWSLPDELEFSRSETVADPETASSARVRELYKNEGGVKQKVNPWWKFW